MSRLKRSLGLLLLPLSACAAQPGGDFDEGWSLEAVTNAISDPATTPLPASVIGFYDVDARGSVRAIRNDLVGSLSAMVQFAQSHTVDPRGNDAHEMPSVVAQRSALLLVTPTRGAAKLQIVARVNGVERLRTAMAPPDAIPRADSTRGDERPDLVYSRRAHSVVLPWNVVVPGLTLELVDDQGRSGTLDSQAIEFAAPATVVLKSIRLGMLADPPESHGDFYMLDDPARAGADYFATIPTARLVLGSYDPQRLSPVIVGDGTIYTTASRDQGGTYDGDMREDVAKATVSGGINLADQGISSSSMRDGEQTRPTEQVVIHHAQGLYANGLQSHGLSGGGGIGTLYSSYGNEASHELGHNWGLGHYPGSNGDDYFWTAHHADSGWGFIAHRNRMRANVDWNGPSTTVVSGHDTHQSFAGVYGYNADAMSGGTVESAYSRYTHHTGYSARRIQQHFDRAVPSLASSTGYLRWDRTTNAMREAPAPAAASGSRLRAVGVPVYTFLGGYDPGTGTALLYPPFRGNYGHVFELPAPASSGNACWLEVSFADGATMRASLATTRHDNAAINKVHVNVALSRNPTGARLSCRISGTTRELARTSVVAGSAALPPPVQIGAENDYSALAAVEIPRLVELLRARSVDAIPLESAEIRSLLDSHRGSIGGLPDDARAIATRMLSIRARLGGIASYVDAHRAELARGDAAALAALTSEVGKRGLIAKNGPLDAFGRITVSSGACLSMTSAEPPTAIVETCSDAARMRFAFDARGAIHPAARPELCLTAGGSDAQRFLPCDVERANQSFVAMPDRTLRPVSDPSKALDVANGTTVILYGAHGGSNQQWSLAATSLEPIWMLRADALAYVVRALSSSNTPFAAIGPITLSDGSCLATTSALTGTVETCADVPRMRFEIDARGAIHPVASPDLCLTAAASEDAVEFLPCDVGRPEQVFRSMADRTVRPASDPTMALDFAWGTTVITYGAHGGWNQQWRLPTQTSSPIVAVGPITLSNGACMATTSSTPPTATVEPCADVARMRFGIDARGAIHPSASPALCLTAGATGEPVRFLACDANRADQAFRAMADGTVRPSSATTKGLDFAWGTTVITYGVHGGWNQRWHLPTP